MNNMKSTKKMSSFELHAHWPSDSPRDLSQWHLRKVNNQWNYDPWQAFSRPEYRKWNHCHDHVLSDAVMSTEQKPSHNYMAWCISVGFEFIAQEMYLYDPRQVTYNQEASTSNPPKDFQTTYSQPPTQQSFWPTNRPFTDLNVTPGKLIN